MSRTPYLRIGLTHPQSVASRSDNSYAPRGQKDSLMRYVLCFILPPLAVLLCGKPGTAFLNVILTVLGIVPGIIHALIVVGSCNADARNAALVAAMRYR